MKNLKKLFKSRTFWFNILTGALVIVDKLTGDVIPTEASATIISVGNIVLRLLTTKSVSEK